MEKNIDDFLLDIAEAKEKPLTPGFSLTKKDSENIVKNISKIVDFENNISDYKELKRIINFLDKNKNDSLDDTIEETDVEISKSLKDKMMKTKAILDKHTENLSEKEEDVIESFIDELISLFIQKKLMVKSDYKETGAEIVKMGWAQSFPVRLEVDGKSYYGLVRPPTGMITWQGTTARKLASDMGIPVKFPIMNTADKNNPVFKAKRGAAGYSDFMSFQGVNDKVDFDFDDSDAAKEKVHKALADKGVKFVNGYYLKGINKGIEKVKLDDIISESFESGITKSVEFWKDITKIF